MKENFRPWTSVSRVFSRRTYPWSSVSTAWICINSLRSKTALSSGRLLPALNLRIWFQKPDLLDSPCTSLIKVLAMRWKSQMVSWIALRIMRPPKLFLESTIPTWQSFCPDALGQGAFKKLLNELPMLKILMQPKWSAKEPLEMLTNSERRRIS